MTRPFLRSKLERSKLSVLEFFSDYVRRNGIVIEARVLLPFLVEVVAKFFCSLRLVAIKLPFATFVFGKANARILLVAQLSKMFVYVSAQKTVLRCQ